MKKNLCDRKCLLLFRKLVFVAFEIATPVHDSLDELLQVNKVLMFCCCCFFVKIGVIVFVWQSCYFNVCWLVVCLFAFLSMIFIRLRFSFFHFIHFAHTTFSFIHLYVYDFFFGMFNIRYCCSVLHCDTNRSIVWGLCIFGFFFAFVLYAKKNLWCSLYFHIYVYSENNRCRRRLVCERELAICSPKVSVTEVCPTSRPTWRRIVWATLSTSKPTGRGNSQRFRPFCVV